MPVLRKSKIDRRSWAQMAEDDDESDLSWLITGSDVERGAFLNVVIAQEEDEVETLSFSTSMPQRAASAKILIPRCLETVNVTALEKMLTAHVARVRRGAWDTVHRCPAAAPWSVWKTEIGSSVKL